MKGEIIFPEIPIVKLLEDICLSKNATKAKLQFEDVAQFQLFA